MNDRAPDHPEAGTMAAFVEGRLAPDELKSVSEHLRGCRDCRTVVTETSRFEREERGAGSPTSTTTWWLAAAAVLAAIFIAVPLYRRYEMTTPIARLIEVAPRQHR